MCLSPIEPGWLRIPYERTVCRFHVHDTFNLPVTDIQHAVIFSPTSATIPSAANGGSIFVIRLLTRNLSSRNTRVRWMCLILVAPEADRQSVRKTVGQTLSEDAANKTSIKVQGDQKL